MSSEGEGLQGGVGAFRILRTLGEGSRGTVYLAEQAQPRRLVALKLLHGPQAHAAARMRFEHGVAALGALRHPGIAGLIESGVTDDGRPFLVLEYVDGLDLSSHVARAVPGRRQRVELLARVCDAIDHAHRRGVIHGDLKPANIRVDAAGLPRVLDFADGEPASLTGTPASMAPEQARGEAATEGSDVYALGLLLLELLTGAPARELDGLTPSAARLQVANAPALLTERHRALRGDLRLIVEKATAAEPARRYASPAALAEDLRNWSCALPIRARRVGWPRRSLLFVRRHRMGVALTAVVLASLATTLLLLLASTRDANASADRLRRLGDEIGGLADERVLGDLERRADDDLWPATPERVPAMQAWLREAAAVATHREPMRHMLANLEQDGELGSLLRKDVGDLRARLDRFVDPQQGRVAEIEARLATALALEERTIGEHALEWQACLEAVARSPRYGGLHMAPQCGLVPLGEDAVSRCAEFAVDGTGELPWRDPATGRLRPPREEDAVVLVLIPGGEHRLFTVVSMVITETVRPPEPPREFTVTTPPFLLGKYELTQAQCVRLGRCLRPPLANPSTYGPGWSTGRQPPVTGLHPVESLSFLTAQRLLGSVGLCLPSDQWWEVAARGGEGPCGAELGLDALECTANVVDLQYDRGNLGVQKLLLERLLDDGYEIHGPVGSFRPNAYGLFDTLGNVGEMCTGTEPGSQLFSRGCNYSQSPLRVDPAVSTWLDPDGVYATVGVRPARLLEGLAVESVVQPAEAGSMRSAEEAAMLPAEGVGPAAAGEADGKSSR